MFNDQSQNESRELEQRLSEALEKMRANMRQGRRVVAIRSMYKELIKADPDERDDDDDDENDEENA